MKVSELPYRRVTLEEVKAVMEDVIPRIRNAKSVEEILAARDLPCWTPPSARSWRRPSLPCCSSPWR